MDLDKLSEEIERVLEAVAVSGRVRPEQVRHLRKAAGEYAAAQVEAHARPGPWPPRGPSPWQHDPGQHPAQRSAS